MQKPATQITSEVTGNMKTKICVKKLNGLIVNPANSDNTKEAASLMAEMMKLGYCPSEDLFNALKTVDLKDLITIADEALSVLRHMKGADVSYVPMYPNFPQQVMNASALELFMNAICHYWTLGQWKPSYETLPREFAFEATKFKEIGLVTERQFEGVFTTLLSSNDSLSEEDKGIVQWFVENRSDLSIPKTIPFKETVCIVAGMFLDKGLDISPLVKTATDVLRVVTFLNGGDVSLATNTKFKSMPRSRRRVFAGILDKVASEEDINRHRSKWTKLFHSLHIGDYSKPHYDIAKKIRNNKHIATFNGRVDAAIKARNVDGCVSLLMQRPGEFSRRLDHTLRVFPKNQEFVVDAFGSVADKVSTKVLTQILGHLQIRGEKQKRIVFPKGVVQRAQMIPALSPLPTNIISYLGTVIERSLISRFSKMETLGKVYIDPELKLCPIPAQQRSASEGAFSVARGTRLDIGSKNTLRCFIYWVGRDIDLSATLHDENFQMIEQISYTNLRSKKYEAAHSGDITNAPHGASEFIDITIDQAVKFGARYLAMNVLVFSGPTFKEHEACYAGWMTRAKPNSNEIYDPKTVEQKVDLASNSKNSIPVVFDLVERKAIWCDLNTNSRISFRGARVGNNIHSNKASIQQTLESIVKASNKVSLHKLFELHATARGEIVNTREEADTIFSLDEGTTPYDVNVISSEYIA